MYKEKAEAEVKKLEAKKKSPAVKKESVPTASPPKVASKMPVAAKSL